MKKFFFLIWLLLATQAHAAITFFGQALQPADNSTQAGPTVTVTPPASMTAGQLVVVTVIYRSTTGTLYIQPNNKGGQEWSWWRQEQANNLTVRQFWCRFNGTWSANPSFSLYTDNDASQAVDSAATLNTSAYMLVFTPTDSAKWWVPTIGPIYGTFTAGTSPFTKTITGVTTASRFGSTSFVAVATWATGDDNTWGTLSGTNWTKASLTAQLRNTTGTDSSITHAYQIQTSAGATNNVSQNQATLGGDAGVSIMTVFMELDIPSAGTGGTLALASSGIGGDNSSNTSVTVSSLTVASGNSVVGGVHFETAAGGYLTQITDNQSNEYIPIQIVHHDNLEQGLITFYRPNITNSPTSITASFSVSEIARGIAAHVLNGGIELDKYTGLYWETVDSGSPDNMSTAQVTPTTNGQYLFGWVTNTDAPQDEPGWFAAGGSWTLRQSKGQTAVTEENAAATFDQIQATAAAIDLDVTADFGRAHLLAMATFKAAGAGGGAVLRNLTLMGAGT